MVNADSCAICHKRFTRDHPVSEFGNTLNGELVNDDCYYHELSREIERHPIVSPESIRRARSREEVKKNKP